MLGKRVFAVTAAVPFSPGGSLLGFSVFLGALVSAPRLPTLAIFLSWSLPCPASFSTVLQGKQGRGKSFGSST